MLSPDRDERELILAALKRFFDGWRLQSDETWQEYHRRLDAAPQGIMDKIDALGLIIMRPDRLDEPAVVTSKLDKRSWTALLRTTVKLGDKHFHNEQQIDLSYLLKAEEARDFAPYVARSAMQAIGHTMLDPLLEPVVRATHAELVAATKAMDRDR